MRIDLNILCLEYSPPRNHLLKLSLDIPRFFYAKVNLYKRDLDCLLEQFFRMLPQIPFRFFAQGKLNAGEELYRRRSLLRVEPLITDIRRDEQVLIYTVQPWLTEDELDQVATDYIFHEDRTRLLDAINANRLTAVFVTKERS